jgi:hypothetical protein
MTLSFIALHLSLPRLGGEFGLNKSKVAKGTGVAKVLSRRQLWAFVAKLRSLL